MYNYQLTQHDASVLFLNSIHLSDKLGYKSSVMEKMKNQLYSRLKGDFRGLIEGHFSGVDIGEYLSRSGKDKEQQSRLLYEMVQQSTMDHCLLGHCYHTLSGDMEKLRKNVEKKLSSGEITREECEKEYRIKIEMMAYEVEIRCARYRANSRNKLKKTAWKAWIKVLEKVYNELEKSLDSPIEQGPIKL